MAFTGWQCLRNGVFALYFGHTGKPMDCGCVSPAVSSPSRGKGWWLHTDWGSGISLGSTPSASGGLQQMTQPSASVVVTRDYVCLQRRATVRDRHCTRESRETGAAHGGRPIIPGVRSCEKRHQVPSAQRLGRPPTPAGSIVE